MAKISKPQTGLSFFWRRYKFLNNGKINPETLRYASKKKISASGALQSEDIWNFRHYFQAREMNLKITAAEFTRLFAYEGEEYKTKAFELLTNKMNIPKELVPKIVNEELTQDTAMFYDWIENCININKNLCFDKVSFLVHLRHELQHFTQNMQLFRHETKGEEIIKIYSKLKTKTQCWAIDKYVRQFDLEQLKSFLNEQEIAEIAVLKELIKNNKTAEYENQMQIIEKNLYDIYLSQYTDFRKMVIEKMGILRKDTSEGKRAEKIFNETSAEHSYWEQNGQVHWGKYCLDCRESEALAAQSSILLNINEAYNAKNCYLKIIKQEIESLPQNVDKTSKIWQDLEETKPTVKTRFTDWKAAFSYLFD